MRLRPFCVGWRLSIGEFIPSSPNNIFTENFSFACWQEERRTSRLEVQAGSGFAQCADETYSENVKPLIANLTPMFIHLQQLLSSRSCLRLPSRWQLPRWRVAFSWIRELLSVGWTVAFSGLRLSLFESCFQSNTFQTHF